MTLLHCYRSINTGVNPSDLNIGVTRANSIRVKKNINKWVRNITEQITSTDASLGNKMEVKMEEFRNSVYNSLEQWLERYKTAVHDFVGGRDDSSCSDDSDSSCNNENVLIKSVKSRDSIGHGESFVDIISPSKPLRTPTADDFVDITTHKGKFDLSGMENALDDYETREEVFVYTTGVFDLLHYGHAKHLEQAKKSFSKVKLIVGVLSDEVAMKVKGRLIQQCKDRAAALAHIRWIDDIVEAPPTPITKEFLLEHNIDYVVVSPDLEYDKEACLWLEENGGFVHTTRTPGISTSNIMLRILRNYETYIKRSLERGVGREDLKLGFAAANSIMLKTSIQKWQQKFTQEVHKATLTDHPVGHEFDKLIDKVVELVNGWRKDSKVMIDNFIRHNMWPRQ